LIILSVHGAHRRRPADGPGARRAPGIRSPAALDRPRALRRL